MDDIADIIDKRAKQIVESEKQGGNSNVPSKEIPKIDFKLDTTKSYAEQAKDLVGVRATQTAISDESLAKDVTERKKAEILNYADANLKKEEAENKKADILLQEANYGVYNGVATYAGIKKPLPQKMQNILFAILSAVQTAILLAFGIPISIINIIADGVDSVVKKLATLTVSARWIVLVAIGIGAIWLIVIVAKFFLAKIGIIL